jgi:tetratricopeptide (TPR) repeat protein
LTDTWNSAVRASIEDSFLATRLQYAASALTNVLSRLQLYHDRWVVMHQEACAATLVHNEQSGHLMDLRMACLDERREEFASLVDLLQRADRQVVDSAVTSAGRLRTLSRCADPEQLAVAFPMPDDPDQRATIERLQVEVVNAGIALSAGQMDTVADRLPELLAAARSVDYPALEAETLLVQSRFEMFSGRPAAARDATYAAASKAVRARDNELVARAWLTLPGIALNSKGKLDEILQLLDLAASYIAQLPPDHPLEADFHGARGEIRMRQGNLEQGVNDMRTAVAISRSLNLPDLATRLTRLAWGLSHLHEPEKAQQIAQEALAISQREFGPQHPQYAQALKELARVHSQLGHRDTALALQSQVVTIEENLFPDAHPLLAVSIERLGWTYTQVGRFDDAIVAFKRALSMEQSFDDPNWNNVAAAYNDLGDAYISIGAYELAREALESALNVWVEQGQNLAIGIALGNLGNASNRAGRHSEAADYCQRGYDNDLQYLPAGHPDLAYPLTCLGEARLGEGDPQAALAPLQQAHSLRNRIDVDEASLAWTRWLYGRALWESGQNTATGMSHIHFAKETFTTMGDAATSELADVTNWLDAHGAGQ